MKNHVKDPQYTKVLIEKAPDQQIYLCHRKGTLSQKGNLQQVLKLIPQDAKPFYGFLRTIKVQEFLEDTEEFRYTKNTLMAFNSRIFYHYVLIS